MSILQNIINDITKHGHITVDDMMKRVLSLDRKSYYQSTRTLGAQGDFITSPEISQLFGEMIALWAIDQWQYLGRPKQIALLELGPGHGTLMQDFLRVAKLDNQFYNALQIFLYEINPFFIDLQKNKLSTHDKKIMWIKNNLDLPYIPAIIVANEFFDALPIKQYIKYNNQWHEVVLTAGPISTQITFDKITLPCTLNDKLLKYHPNTENNAILEESTESLAIIKQLGSHLVKYTGAALIIDYGYNIERSNRQHTQYKPTLQAVKDHQYIDPLTAIGKSDLTSHVDFDALIRSVQLQEINMAFGTQQEFLLKYGISLRLETLKQKLSKSDFILISKQVCRLISKKQMGDVFKVLELKKR